MSKPGIGAMLSYLGGNEDSVKAFTGALGKTLVALEIREVEAYRSTGDQVGSALRLSFTDGTAIELYDDGQSCCESRYMRTDDKLADFIGAQFLEAEIKDAPPLPSEYDEHEVQFLDVTTSKGVFQIASHNEHNGYYGGFSIRARVVESGSPPQTESTKPNLKEQI